MRSKAVLLPGVTVTLTNAKTGESQVWQYNDGLRGYLAIAMIMVVVKIVETALGH